MKRISGSAIFSINFLSVKSCGSLKNWVSTFEEKSKPKSLYKSVHISWKFFTSSSFFWLKAFSRAFYLRNATLSRVFLFYICTFFTIFSIFLFDGQKKPLEKPVKMSCFWNRKLVKMWQPKIEKLVKWTSYQNFICSYCLVYF